MAENRLDNTKLETAVAEFVKDRQREKYATVMELLEKAVVLVVRAGLFRDISALHGKMASMCARVNFTKSKKRFRICCIVCAQTT